MAQTLVSLLVHVIFSTKHRENLIPPEVEPDLYAYFGGIARQHQSRLLAAGGTANHVHLLLSPSKNVALSPLVAELKKATSAWVKTKDRRLARFHWQDGYGGFSIGQSQVSALTAYLARQKAHHRKKGFQEELMEFLKKYEIKYDTRYLWD